MQKVCLNCGIRKDLKNFPHDARYRSGTSSHCRKCRGSFASHWKKANPERTKKINDSYYKRRRSLLERIQSLEKYLGMAWDDDSQLHQKINEQNKQEK